MEIKSSYVPAVRVNNDMFTPDVLSTIPNMAICDTEYARSIGGPGIEHILDRFDQSGIDISKCTITTRVYDLNEGDSTHPLDWHCDGHNPGDPLNLDNRNFIQYIGHVGPNEIPFEIVDDVISIDHTIYEDHTSYDILAQISNQSVNIKHLPVGQFADIGTTTIHRVLPSRQTGKRMLVIISNIHEFFPILNNNKNRTIEHVTVY